MAATDSMVARLEGELNERNAFIQGLVAAAEDGGRDLSSQEMELIGNARARIEQLDGQLVPLRETAKIAREAAENTRRLDREISNMRDKGNRGPVEYRSAGGYMADYYAARIGDTDAAERIELFNRAAAHQTTADNPGLLPVRIVEPVLDAVDASRPLVSAIGPRDLGAGAWAYARVTQHTLVGPQSAEKAELPSRKMLVTSTPITGTTYGGYVNISKQDIRRTNGAITDMVIADLGGQYAIQTEAATAADLVAAATAATTEIPLNPTALGVAQAVWGAVGQAAAGLRTANIPATRPILAVSPDRLGLIGPLFPNVNPQNAFSSGFSATDQSLQGAQGSIAGLTVAMAVGLPAETVLFLYGSAVRCWEDRYGALSVDEPSVWGMQVGYAGDFETTIIEGGGVISIGQAAA